MSEQSVQTQTSTTDPAPAEGVTGGCCASRAASEGAATASQSAPCCGTASQAAAQGSCCGSAAKAEALASGAGCCG